MHKKMKMHTNPRFVFTRVRFVVVVFIDVVVVVVVVVVVDTAF